MKLSINADFTKMPRAGRVVRAGDAAGLDAFDHARLAHDERHLRRRVIELSMGEKVLLDLPEPVALDHGDLLALDDGRFARIEAQDEEVLEIVARDPLHLTELAWHIGNRHLAAQIETGRILILRDHVIEAMLQGLGATTRHIIEPFKPVRGAYSRHSHGHDHHHGHAQGEADRFGRLPGDPHYGHDHA
ncbi:MAG: urease accessory protein UreE [Rhizobiaceae bacterium]|nr:urease accessory protein UreE [Rhizobiaceae bacterium]MCV0405143.1 urease accessory protein UreE [Rhizobiaceae bacterium]